MTEVYFREVDMTLNKDDKYKDYLVIQSKKIEEHDCNFIEVEHTKTGATIFQMQNNDDNNLFCISFQTIPSNSTGVAHILEHTVLCGSKNFPYKDPFFSMFRRSLNTFMNAMTGSDCTFYPASSQIEKDFYNLFKVYLDAVFFPLLRKVNFLQEGHRIEFVDKNDQAKGLKFKGVVYNEMKGALTSADDVFLYANMETLIPDTPYKFESGGDPKEIPYLSYEEFVDFHKTFYHPSRAIFFFFGNIPITKHLDFLDETLFKNIETTLSPLNPIQKQPRFETPKTKDAFYPATKDDGSDRLLGISWLTVSVSEQLDILTLSLIDSLLLETDASYLRKAILDSGLATSIESIACEQMREVPWILLCKGCHKDNLKKLEDLILTTLQKVADEGFDKSLVDSALYQLEFSKAEELSKTYSGRINYALSVFSEAILPKHHGCDPIAYLSSKKLFDELKGRLENKDFLSKFMYENIINNNHRVTLMLHPNTSLIEENNQIEKKLLDEIQKKLTEKEKKMIVEQTKKLEEHQKKKETPDKLPYLLKEDIPKDVKDFKLENKESIFYHEVFTNKVQYIDFLFPIPQIKNEDIPYLSLFAQYLTEVGFGSKSYEESLKKINSCFGHLYASLSLNVDAQDSNIVYPILKIRAVGLKSKQEGMIQTCMEIIESANFDDPKRLESLITQSNTCLNSAIVDNALSYAQSLSLSSVCKNSCLHDIWDGFQHYQFINNIHKNVKENMEDLIYHLKSLQETILRGSFETVICTDKESIDELIPIIKNQNRENMASWIPKVNTSSFSSHARLIPSPVAFTAMGFSTVKYSHPLSPAILVATKLLHNKILHREIREIGGAYGSGARYNPLLGTFHFFGYRDPNLKKTVETCKRSLKDFKELEYSSEDIWNAILGTLQTIDAPLAPGARAIVSYFWKKTRKTKELRQKYREGILDVTKEKLAEAVEVHLKPQLERSALVSFADKSFFDRNNLDTPLPLKELLG